jgi:predicted alpha/beta-fold hydrolase
VPGLAGHLHTLAVLFKKPQLPDAQRWWDRRTRLEVAGGARLGLWWRLGALPENAPVVVIFPGLTGAQDSRYALTAVAALRGRYRVCLICARGCGDSTLGRERPYNARNAEVGAVCNGL